MNLVCFICKDEFMELDQLIVHLKCIHSLTSSSFYHCGIPSCPQTFSCFHSFAKHMTLEILNSSNYSQTLNDININHVGNQSINTIINRDSNVKNSSNDGFKNSKHQYSVDLNALKNSMIKCSLYYYGKFNFSRKEANELKKNITKIITTSIAQELEKIINNNDSVDAETKNSFKSIINFCKNPFEEFDTEYKFLKYLQNNDHYDNPKVITPDNTINNFVFHNTNTIDEKKIKGVILPLKFQFRKYFEAPGVSDAFIKNHDSLKNDICFTNFYNSELWKEKMLKFSMTHTIYIPFFFYIFMIFKLIVH